MVVEDKEANDLQKIEEEDKAPARGDGGDLQYGEKWRKKVSQRTYVYSV